MKSTVIRILVFSFALCAFPLFAQTIEYRVVRVVGQVESPALKRMLQTGDLIQSQDHLKFGSKDSYVIVNNIKTGRKKISGVPDNEPREFIKLLQSFVQPEKRSTASRAVALQYIEFLQNSMAFDTLLVLGDGRIVVNTAKLPLKKPAVIRAWHSNFKKVSFQTISDDVSFSLNAKTLFGENIPQPTPKVIIEYFEDEKEQPVLNPGILLAAFVPIFTDEEKLVAEIRAVLDLPGTRTYKEKLMDVKGYLAAEYANVQEDNLKVWLKTNGVLSE